MTVKEVIAALSKHHPDTPVLRGDNSGGYEDIYEISKDETVEVIIKRTPKTDTAMFGAVIIH